MKIFLSMVVVSLFAFPASAQRFEQRGFVDGKATYFPRTVPQDTAHGVADLLAREEVYWTPGDWFQADAGVDYTPTPTIRLRTTGISAGMIGPSSGRGSRFAAPRRR